MPPRGAHGGGHGGSRRRRVAHAEGHEEGGSERWLVTYADMLTLLLVLFIVLFSISVVNTSKFISLKTSLASAYLSTTGGHVFRTALESVSSESIALSNKCLISNMSSGLACTSSEFVAGSATTRIRGLAAACEVCACII